MTCSMTWWRGTECPLDTPNPRRWGVTTGFILGSDVRPAPKTSHNTESQEPLCPNIFRLYSGKSNMPWNGSGASRSPQSGMPVIRWRSLVWTNSRLTNSGTPSSSRTHRDRGGRQVPPGCAHAVVVAQGNAAGLVDLVVAQT